MNYIITSTMSPSFSFLNAFHHRFVRVLSFLPSGIKKFLVAVLCSVYRVITLVPPSLWTVSLNFGM